MPVGMSKLAELCHNYTAIADSDVDTLSRLESFMPLIADLTGADVFIDCLVHDGTAAIVVAWAPSGHCPSLYSRSVVGELALQENEPAVFRTFSTQGESMKIRGVSQEGVQIQQTVVPIFGDGSNIVAVLIMEQNISEQVALEKDAVLLTETTEYLTKAMIELLLNKRDDVPLMQDGIIIVNRDSVVRFVNPPAQDLLLLMGNLPVVAGKAAPEAWTEFGLIFQSMEERKPLVKETAVGDVAVVIKALPLLQRETVIGGVVILTDISELRRKEKELVRKSTVIQEVHHRVKNNLQTIASLLRLQTRRTENTEVKQALEECISRILSIALVHDILSTEGSDRIEVKETIGQLLGMIIRTMMHDDKPAELEVEGDSLYVDSHQATCLALILDELTQNSIKHAFQDGMRGRINVSLSQRDGMIVIEYRDNGRGFPGDLESYGSLGLQIVRSLAQESLRGSFSIAGFAGGSRASVIFPAAGELRYGTC